MVDLMDLLAPSWLVWIAAGILLHTVVKWKRFLPRVLRDVLEYGKLRSESSVDVAVGKPISRFLSVPKRWFIHFYVWGTIWNTCIFCHALIHCVLDTFLHLRVLDQVFRTVTGDYVINRCYGLTQYHFETLLVLFLITIQVSRRLYECFCVSVFSDSEMSIVHYCLGMYFYSSVGLTALLHLEAGGGMEQQSLDHHHSESILDLCRNYLQWYHIVAILLFFWASHHQTACHMILANLRTQASKRKSIRSKQQLYFMPEGDWFEYVSSPHFFAEILIYVSMLMCFVFSNWKSPFWLVLISTICVLGVSARQTHVWYREKFEDYPKNRKILIPWIY